MTSPSSHRWLIGSLILNVFLVGAIAGALGLMGRQPGPRPGPGMGAPLDGFRGVESSLSTEGQVQLRAFFGKQPSRMREHFVNFRKQREALEAVLAAEPFDAAAAERAFADLRSQEGSAAQAVQTRLIALAQSLSPEDRRAFASGMNRLPMPPGLMPRGMPPPMPQGGPPEGMQPRAE